MEERKRPAALDRDDPAPPAKRQAVTVNGAKSHHDADLPMKDDIEAFQKDAILRQMKEYKREKAALETQISQMEEKAAWHDDHLRVLDLWFQQLVDEIRILVNSTSSLGTSQTSSADADADLPFPTSLLFSDVKTFTEHLSSRSENIKSTLSDLFAKLPGSSPEVNKLQKELARYEALEKEHSAQLHRITMEKEQVSEQFDTATHRYMIAEKKIDRIKSVQVAKLEKAAIASNTKEDTGATSSTTEVNGVNGGLVSEEAEALRKEAVAEVAQRRKQLEQLEAENNKLTEQVTSFTVRLAGLSDDDYAKTDLFKALKSQHEDVIKRINHLEATNVQLREEAQKLQAERTAYRIQVDEESQAMLSESESNLAQSEANLARIRHARDELVTKVQMLEQSQKDSTNSTERIKELATAKESRIAALEAQIERLRLQVAEQESVEGESKVNMDDMSPEQLRIKIVNLQKDYHTLNNEVPSLEAAWKKAQALAHKKISEVAAWEEQVSRANADKAKADQKFFAAMKTKEAREQENRVLRQQIAKSTEIVAQLKDSEAASRLLVDKNEKQLAEARVQMEELSIQYRSLQQKLNEHQITAEGHSNQISEFKKAMAAKDEAHLAASHAHRESEAEREKLRVQVDEARAQVEKWKKKSAGNSSEEEKHMRSMLQCQICKNNWKDTALKTCGHVFCSECVNERLSSRSRKCPGCGKGFGKEDCMKVHI